MRSFARIALILPLLGLSLLILDAPEARAEADTASVTVVHAVPGLTVDVYVNGNLTLPAFVPGTITDPLALPAGTYNIVIVPAGGDPMVPAISGSATVAAGDDASIVAHLDAAGAPTLSVFANSLGLADRGEGRVIVRHVAAAPTVDVRLFRRIWRWRRFAGALEGASNGDGAQVDVRAGRYQAEIAPAGSTNPVFGPANLRIRSGVATIVYAYGSLADGTFDLLVHTRKLRSETAKVTVVHAVLGLTVDVYLNGNLALPAFAPRTVTDPIELPCGDYNVVIVPQGGNPAMPAIQATATLDRGANVSIVAHLAADGTPTLSVFENDVSPSRRGSRVVARHTAAAPAVDVRIDLHLRWWSWFVGALENVTNGQQGGVDLWPARYAARITPAGQPHVVVLGPAQLRLRRGQVYFAYAIGSLEGGTLELLVHALPSE